MRVLCKVAMLTLKGTVIKWCQIAGCGIDFS